MKKFLKHLSALLVGAYLGLIITNLLSMIKLPWIWLLSPVYIGGGIAIIVIGIIVGYSLNYNNKQKTNI